MYRAGVEVFLTGKLVVASPECATRREAEVWAARFRMREAALRATERSRAVIQVWNERRQKWQLATDLSVEYEEYRAWCAEVNKVFAPLAEQWEQLAAAYGAGTVRKWLGPKPVF